MRTTLLLLSTAAVLTATAGGGTAQTLPTRSFSKPEVEHDDPFTAVSGIRELRDGRVIVSDVRDKTLQVIDLRSGEAKPIGREGQGPGEYSLPGGLFALPNDTTLLSDLLNRRFLVIGPDVKPAGTISLLDDAREGFRVAGQVRGSTSAAGSTTRRQGSASGRRARKPPTRRRSCATTAAPNAPTRSPTSSFRRTIPR